MIRYTMVRRTACVLAIAGCALSFIVVCLGACLAATTAEHACCESEAGWQALPSDCCSVVPAVAKHSVFVAALPTPAEMAPAPMTLAAEPRTAIRPVPVAASPPLVLRI